MSQLLRGPQERFNPQIHTEKNSLTTLMAKNFAVHTKTFDLFERYNKFQSWMYHTGRINQGASKGVFKKASKNIKDNAYRISYKGMDVLPAYSTGNAYFGAWVDAASASPTVPAGVTYASTFNSTNIATDTLCSVDVKHDPANGIFGDKFNPNDRITLGAGSGITIIFTRKGRLGNGGTHYVYDGKTVGPAALFKTAHLAVDTVFTEAGNVFGEGSLRGYQRTSRNKWKINYSWISRYTLTMTGSAQEQEIAWIYNPDNPSGKMWEFAEVVKADGIHRMMVEQGLRYSRTSMDASTHAWFENSGQNLLTLNGFSPESGIEAPVIGDGWIPQIEDNATFDYNPNAGLAHGVIEAFTNILSTRSPKGSSGNMYFGVTDRIGRTAFERGMRKLLSYDEASGTGGLTNVVYNIVSGQELNIGFSINKYTYLGNTFMIVEDELLNHPGMYNTSGGLVGTGNIYILNTTTIDGVPNFELFARNERDYRKKFVDGMHSLSQQEGNKAASGFDGSAMHILSELLPILYDAKSCGVLRASEAYSGGALTGSTLAGEKAYNFTF